MIDREDLLDNPHVRKLARQLKKIPGVIMVRWNPPFRASYLATVGADAGENDVMFSLTTGPSTKNVEYARVDDAAPYIRLDSEGYCYFTRCIGQTMYESEEGCLSVYNSFVKAIKDFI